MVLAPVTSTPVSAPLASTGASGAAVRNPPAQPAAAASEASAALQTVLTTVRLDAAATQNGLASLMANVLRASAAGNLPPQVQSAVQQLMALHLPTDTPPDAAAVKTAMLSSGLFTEASLANGETPADLKSMLGQLTQAAERWQAKTPAQNQPATPSSTPNVPPPVRGGQPAAQSPAQPTLPSNPDPALTAKLLAHGGRAALARQTLLQMASLPDPAKPGDTRWMFDVPLMTPHGAAVAQLVVARDGNGSSAETPAPVWRIGLAINIEPLGPVRANLALSGDHAWVTIGADRPESLKQLAGNSSWLTDALSAVTLDSDIAFQSTTGTGKPAGQLVNHAT